MVTKLDLKKKKNTEPNNVLLLMQVLIQGYFSASNPHE
jgi:hypothetical protein